MLENAMQMSACEVVNVQFGKASDMRYDVSKKDRTCTNNARWESTRSANSRLCKNHTCIVSRA